MSAGTFLLEVKGRAFDNSAMPAGSHPLFVAPSPANTRIWRYMDFTKYMWLLQKRALFFPRADLLGDPFEGSLASANPSLWPVVYPQIPLEAHNNMAPFRSILPQWTFINSWHASERESAAMWKLYLTTNEGIAVVSTYERLIQVLPENAYVGLVKYIDYDTEWMPDGNLFLPFLHKRKSFEHEREVRAIIMDAPSRNAEGQWPLNASPGRTVPIDVSILIESVRVSPTAPAWLFDLIADTSQSVGIRVTTSDLAKAPFF